MNIGILNEKCPHCKNGLCESRRCEYCQPNTNKQPTPKKTEVTQDVVEEMVAFIEVDGVGVALFQSRDGLKLTVSGSEEFIREMPQNVIDTQAHQQGFKDGEKKGSDQWYKKFIRSEWVRYQQGLKDK